MAGEKGVEQVLSRLNDLGDRLVSNKRFDDLTELVQKLVDANKKLANDLEGARAEVTKATKTQTERSAELEDFVRKEIKKLRDEMIDLVENLDTGDGDSDEPPKWLMPLLGEIGPAFADLRGVLQDKDVRDAVKGKLVGWVKGAKNKKLPAGDDE